MQSVRVYVLFDETKNVLLFAVVVHGISIGAVLPAAIQSAATQSNTAHTVRFVGTITDPLCNDDAFLLPALEHFCKQSN
jgi:hypothetical protein